MRAIATLITLLAASVPAGPTHLASGSSRTIEMPAVSGVPPPLRPGAAELRRDLAEARGATAGSRTQPQRAPQRIISLIPAVTEMLFAIGAGPQIVAVSSFDRYPPEVDRLQRVGALIDPDVERILSLRPDLVIVFGSQTDLRAQLEKAHIPLYTYTDAGLADIATVMRALGTRVGREQAAARAAGDIEARIDAVRAGVAGRPKPATLIVFDREPFTLRGIYASGGIGFIHEMVEAAGGRNVFGDVKGKAVQATTELILGRRPEVILELRADALAPDATRRELAAWQPLRAVPAVRDGRVYIFGDQRTVVPGPRIAEAVELIARTLHPGAFK